MKVYLFTIGIDTELGNYIYEWCCGSWYVVELSKFFVQGNNRVMAGFLTCLLAGISHRQLSKEATLDVCTDRKYFYDAFYHGNPEVLSVWGCVGHTR